MGSSLTHELLTGTVMPDRSGLVVGLDLGTSGLKAIAINEHGSIVARASASYPTHRLEAGASEQDPADWINAIKSAASDIKADTNNAPWISIGLSGMLPTLVTVDEANQPNGNAITWEDARADEYGDRLRTQLGEDLVYQTTGQWVDGRYLLPMWARLVSVDSKRASNTAMLLGAKDFIFGWLTGQFLTDPSTATGFGCYDLRNGSWAGEFVKHIAKTTNGEAPALPRIEPSQFTAEILSPVARELGLSADITVCLGAADSVLGATGMGSHHAGDIAYVGGTSTIILGVTDELKFDAQHRYLITPMAEPGMWGVEMDLLSTGSSFRWLATLTGSDENDMMQLAETGSDVAGPVFLPYLAPGEQGALWDPTLSGSIHGLNLTHTSADISRALADGIVIESVRCVDALTDNGFSSGPILVSGGSANHSWFRQQLADACGRDVITGGGDEPDRSALGAALVAARATGLEISVDIQRGESLQPNPDRADSWSRKVATFNALLEKTRV